MPKCDFNKVATEITLSHGCSPVSLLRIFRTPSYKNTYGGLLLKAKPNVHNYLLHYFS